MKIAFMGSPGLAVPCLEALATEHEVVAVVTQPDKPAGRGHKLTAPPVKDWAVEHGAPVLQPERARNPEFIEQLAVYAPDAIAVVAFGQILPQSVLDLAPLGCVNLHFSLLPRWRGAAPVQYAIWHGDRVTGITTQFMVQKLDAGDIIQQMEVSIDPDETSGQLLERLTGLGAGVLAETMREVAAGRATRRPQNELDVTLAPQIQKEMAQLAWNEAAAHLHNTVRAMNPWPVAWFSWRGEVVKVWKSVLTDAGSAATGPGTIMETRGAALTVATGTSALGLLEVQPAGKPRMSGGDWARGARLEVGMELV